MCDAVHRVSANTPACLQRPDFAAAYISNFRLTPHTICCLAVERESAGSWLASITLSVNRRLIGKATAAQWRILLLSGRKARDRRVLVRVNIDALRPQHLVN